MKLFYVHDKEIYELEHGPGTYDEYLASQDSQREVNTHIFPSLFNVTIQRILVWSFFIFFL